MSSDDNQVQALDDILFRFVSSPDDKLEAPLSRVLPKILLMLDGSQAVRNKVLSILTHLNKRIKVLPSLQLPTAALVHIFTTATNATILTFTLMYLDTALQRLPPQDAAQLCWVLLSGIHMRPVGMQTQILLIVVKHLHAMAQGGLFSKYITTFTDKVEKRARTRGGKGYYGVRPGTATSTTTASATAATTAGAASPVSPATSTTAGAGAGAGAVVAGDDEDMAWPSLGEMSAETVQAVPLPLIEAARQSLLPIYTPHTPATASPPPPFSLTQLTSSPQSIPLLMHTHTTPNPAMSVLLTFLYDIIAYSPAKHYFFSTPLPSTQRQADAAQCTAYAETEAQEKEEQMMFSLSPERLERVRKITFSEKPAEKSGSEFIRKYQGTATLVDKDDDPYEMLKLSSVRLLRMLTQPQHIHLDVAARPVLMRQLAAVREAFGLQIETDAHVDTSANTSVGPGSGTGAGGAGGASLLPVLQAVGAMDRLVTAAAHTATHAAPHPPTPASAADDADAASAADIADLLDTVESAPLVPPTLLPATPAPRPDAPTPSLLSPPALSPSLAAPLLVLAAALGKDKTADAAEDGVKRLGLDWAEDPAGEVLCALYVGDSAATSTTVGSGNAGGVAASPAKSAATINDLTSMRQPPCAVAKARMLAFLSSSARAMAALKPLLRIVSDGLTPPPPLPTVASMTRNTDKLRVAALGFTAVALQRSPHAKTLAVLAVPLAKKMVVGVEASLVAMRKQQQQQRANMMQQGMAQASGISALPGFSGPAQIPGQTSGSSVTIPIQASYLGDSSLFFGTGTAGIVTRQHTLSSVSQYESVAAAMQGAAYYVMGLAANVNPGIVVRNLEIWELLMEPLGRVPLSTIYTSVSTIFTKSSSSSTQQEGQDHSDNQHELGVLAQESEDPDFSVQSLKSSFSPHANVVQQCVEALALLRTAFHSLLPDKDVPLDASPASPCPPASLSALPAPFAYPPLLLLLRSRLCLLLAAPAATKLQRLTALQFLNRIFPFEDALSRFLNCLCVSDEDHDVREEARRGLDVTATTPTPVWARVVTEWAQRQRQRAEGDRDGAGDSQEGESGGDGGDSAMSEPSLSSPSSPGPSSPSCAAPPLAPLPPAPPAVAYALAHLYPRFPSLPALAALAQHCLALPASALMALAGTSATNAATSTSTSTCTSAPLPAHLIPAVMATAPSKNLPYQSSPRHTLAALALALSSASPTSPTASLPPATAPLPLPLSSVPLPSLAALSTLMMEAWTQDAVDQYHHAYVQAELEPEAEAIAVAGPATASSPLAPAPLLSHSLAPAAALNTTHTPNAHSMAKHMYLSRALAHTHTMSKSTDAAAGVGAPSATGDANSGPLSTLLSLLEANVALATRHAVIICHDQYWISEFSKTRKAHIPAHSGSESSSSPSEKSGFFSFSDIIPVFPIMSSPASTALLTTTLECLAALAQHSPALSALLAAASLSIVSLLYALPLAARRITTYLLSLAAPHLSLPILAALLASALPPLSSPHMPALLRADMAAVVAAAALHEPGVGAQARDGVRGASAQPNSQADTTASASTSGSAPAALVDVSPLFLAGTPALHAPPSSPTPSPPPYSTPTGAALPSPLPAATVLGALSVVAVVLPQILAHKCLLPRTPQHTHSPPSPSPACPATSVLVGPFPVSNALLVCVRVCVWWLAHRHVYYTHHTDVHQHQRASSAAYPCEAPLPHLLVTPPSSEAVYACAHTHSDMTEALTLAATALSRIFLTLPAAPLLATAQSQSARYTAATAADPTSASALAHPDLPLPLALPSLLAVAHAYLQHSFARTRAAATAANKDTVSGDAVLRERLSRQSHALTEALIVMTAHIPIGDARNPKSARIPGTDISVAVTLCYRSLKALSALFYYDLHVLVGRAIASVLVAGKDATQRLDSGDNATQCPSIPTDAVYDGPVYGQWLCPVDAYGYSGRGSNVIQIRKKSGALLALLSLASSASETASTQRRAAARRDYGATERLFDAADVAHVEVTAVRHPAMGVGKRVAGGHTSLLAPVSLLAPRVDAEASAPILFPSSSAAASPTAALLALARAMAASAPTPIALPTELALTSSEKVLRNVLEDISGNISGSLAQRSSACVWLLVVLKHCSGLRALAHVSSAHAQQYPPSSAAAGYYSPASAATSTSASASEPVPFLIQRSLLTALADADLFISECAAKALVLLAAAASDVDGRLDSNGDRVDVTAIAGSATVPTATASPTGAGAAVATDARLSAGAVAEVLAYCWRTAAAAAANTTSTSTAVSTATSVSTTATAAAPPRPAPLSPTSRPLLPSTSRRDLLIHLLRALGFTGDNSVGRRAAAATHGLQDMLSALLGEVMSPNGDAVAAGVEGASPTATIENIQAAAAAAAAGMGVGTSMGLGDGPRPSTPAALSGSVAGSAGASGTRVQTDLATCREFAAVALELGQPALAYGLLALATHHPVWGIRNFRPYADSELQISGRSLRVEASEPVPAATETKTGVAAAATATTSTSTSAPASTAGAVPAALRALLPRLHRYTHDPTESVRVAMTRLWRALIPNHAATLRKHYSLLLDAATATATHRNTRIALSSVASLCELLGPSHVVPALTTQRLGALWTAAMQLLDAVDTGLRSAAASLARTLLSLTETLCSATHPLQERALVAVLPVLTEKGANSPLVLVRAIALAALAKIAEVGGMGLRPHLSSLLTCLLQSHAYWDPLLAAQMRAGASALSRGEGRSEAGRESAASSSSGNATSTDTSNSSGGGDVEGSDTVGFAAYTPLLAAIEHCLAAAAPADMRVVVGALCAGVESGNVGVVLAACKAVGMLITQVKKNAAATAAVSAGSNAHPTTATTSTTPTPTLLASVRANLPSLCNALIDATDSAAARTHKELGSALAACVGVSVKKRVAAVVARLLQRVGVVVPDGCGEEIRQSDQYRSPSGSGGESVYTHVAPAGVLVDPQSSAAAAGTLLRELVRSASSKVKPHVTAIAAAALFMMHWASTSSGAGAGGTGTGGSSGVPLTVEYGLLPSIRTGKLDLRLFGLHGDAQAEGGDAHAATTATAPSAGATHLFTPTHNTLLHPAAARDELTQAQAALRLAPTPTDADPGASDGGSGKGSRVWHDIWVECAGVDSIGLRAYAWEAYAIAKTGLVQASTYRTVQCCLMLIESLALGTGARLPPMPLLPLLTATAATSRRVFAGKEALFGALVAVVAAQLAATTAASASAPSAAINPGTTALTTEATNSTTGSGAAAVSSGAVATLLRYTELSRAWEWLCREVARGGAYGMRAALAMGVVAGMVPAVAVEAGAATDSEGSDVTSTSTATSAAVDVADAPPALLPLLGTALVSAAAYAQQAPFSRPAPSSSSPQTSTPLCSSPSTAHVFAASPLARLLAAAAATDGAKQYFTEPEEARGEGDARVAATASTTATATAAATVTDAAAVVGGVGMSTGAPTASPLSPASLPASAPVQGRVEDTMEGAKMAMAKHAGLQVETLLVAAGRLYPHASTLSLQEMSRVLWTGDGHTGTERMCADSGMLLQRVVCSGLSAVIALHTRTQTLLLSHTASPTRPASPLTLVSPCAVALQRHSFPILLHISLRVLAENLPLTCKHAALACLLQLFLFTHPCVIDPAHHVRTLAALSGFVGDAKRATLRVAAVAVLHAIASSFGTAVTMCNNGGDGSSMSDTDVTLNIHRASSANSTSVAIATVLRSVRDTVAAAAAAVEDVGEEVRVLCARALAAVAHMPVPTSASIDTDAHGVHEQAHGIVSDAHSSGGAAHTGSSGGMGGMGGDM